jgi:hypothetical protein
MISFVSSSRTLFIPAFIPFVPSSPALLSPVFISHFFQSTRTRDISRTTCHFNVFVTHISTSKSCLMITALVKYKMLPYSVITENFYVSKSGIRHTSNQANIKLEILYNSDTLTLSNEQSPSWETDSHFAGKGIHCSFMESEGLLPCSQEDSKLTHLNYVHVLNPYFFKINFNIVLQSRPTSKFVSGILSSGFPTQTMYAFLISPKRTACPVPLILLHFIVITIFKTKLYLHATKIQ